MRIGAMVDNGSTFTAFLDQVQRAADAGLSSVWAAQVFRCDALTALAVAGQRTPGIELGTGVVPTYPRHPLTLAEQALTVQAATGNRLALGIGLSHQVVIEGVYGMSFDKPARHMREYLSVLLPALRGETTQFEGETLTGRMFRSIDIPEASPPPVLLAALAPVMLRLAGAVADGTVTWMTGPRALADHIVPSISKAAADAGRPSPRVVAALPVCITADAAAAREKAAQEFAMYGQLPSYRAMLDKEGAGGPADVAVVGDEDAVAAQIGALVDTGITDFVAAPYGGDDAVSRVLALLADLARRS